MLKKIILIGIFFWAYGSLLAQGQQWSAEKAKEWYEKQNWICGVNYIPANAINYTEMWDKTGFSPKVIDRELALAQGIGINSVRVVLQYAVYEDDPSYFRKTFERFLSICDKYGIRVIPCFFDDCVFGVNTDPTIGKQPEPLEGWYAWAWSPSPGYSKVADEREHDKLERYVKDIMQRHKDDPRILFWDLYNEPANTLFQKEYHFKLLKKVFAWARTIDPSQPITTGIYLPDMEINPFLIENSDIITFHCYADPEYTEQQTLKMLQYGRPVICTEWMLRTQNSTIKAIMPRFKELHVGSIIWGLVNGKTQTHLPWGHRPEDLPYTGVWQCDIFYGDFTPYDPTEIDLIRQLTR